MVANQQRNLMTIEDVADYLQLNKRFVQDNKEKFPFFFNITGGSKGLRARFGAVEKWAEEQEQIQNPDILSNIRNSRKKLKISA